MLADKTAGDEPKLVPAPSTRRAGEPGHGAFLCSGCGYGVAVKAVLPVCPMCGGTEWEEPAARAPAPRVR